MGGWLGVVAGHMADPHAAASLLALLMKIPTRPELKRLHPYHPLCRDAAAPSRCPSSSSATSRSPASVRRGMEGQQGRWGGRRLLSSGHAQLPALPLPHPYPAACRPPTLPSSQPTASRGRPPWARFPATWAPSRPRPGSWC
jgi:hypothetical protein